jgi:hypothetical protein
MLRGDFRHRSGRDQQAMREITLALVEEMSATAAAAGARIAFVYLPVYGEIDKPDPAMTGRERSFFTYWRQHGIESVYLRPFFLEKLRSGTEFKTFGHWGPVEHRTAAEGVKATILERGLLNPAAAPPRSATP